jgi:putative phosphoribosyl transferase
LSANQIEVSMSKATAQQASYWSSPVGIPDGDVILEGELNLPRGARGVVIFAHGSGSSRHSPRNQLVARTIREAGIGTLLFDLLTMEEESADVFTHYLRFDIGLLAERLVNVTRWLNEEESRIKKQAKADHLRPGYFGASTGGAAALVAAATLGERIGAVVSRGGRPDLADQALAQVKSPTLLIVGGRDEPVIALNQEAWAKLRCEKELNIITGATHLFEEPGTLDEVARLAAEWFRRHLQA